MKASFFNLRFAILILTSIFWLSSFKAQTILTAGGLSAYIATPPAGGGGGGGCTASYANTGGQGNRSSIITVTQGGGVINNSIGHFVDGSYSDGTAFWNNAVALDGSTTWVRFDFGSGHTATITEATYYQSTSTAEGTWQLQGSNDASAWTNLGSTFTLGGATTQVITTLAGNTTAYRYYRLLGISGSTSFTPWIRGIDFKLCYT